MRASTSAKTRSCIGRGRLAVRCHRSAVGSDVQRRPLLPVPLVPVPSPAGPSLKSFRKFQLRVAAGSLPDRKLLRLGAHTGIWQYARSNVTARSASLSRFGARTLCWPYIGSSGLKSSTTMCNTLGRAGCGMPEALDIARKIAVAAQTRHRAVLLFGMALGNGTRQLIITCRDIRCAGFSRSQNRTCGALSAEPVSLPMSYRHSILTV